ncbi:MAG: aminotransferase class I/II-fold pyridoxal phosphate-dependent enzyme [Bacteroidota bacterium]
MPVFSGTSYLGLDRHPLFIELVTQGLRRYGTHYGGSRRSTLVPSIFAEVEAAIANWTGAPAALLVSSGTAAGQLVVRYLSEQQRQLHASPLVHPALTWPGNIQHTDWATWHAASQEERNILLTDSVNPLRVTWPSGLAQLKGGTATLVVDDSHLIGHYGPQSAGSWRQLTSQWSGPLMVTASLGKALCIPAGIILGDEATIGALQRMIHYGGASPPNPAFLHAWLHAGALLKTQRQRLKSTVAQVQQLLHGRVGIRCLPEFPVIGLAQHDWTEQLAKRDLLISSFRYPGPTDQRYSRIVLSAGHTDAEVAQLLQALQQLID